MAPAPWPKAIQIWAMIPSCVYAMVSLLGQNALSTAVISESNG